MSNVQPCHHTKKQTGVAYVCQDCRVEQSHLLVWERELREPEGEDGLEPGFVIVQPDKLMRMYP